MRYEEEMKLSSVLDSYKVSDVYEVHIIIVVEELPTWERFKGRIYLNAQL